MASERNPDEQRLRRVEEHLMAALSSSSSTSQGDRRPFAAHRMTHRLDDRCAADASITRRATTRPSQASSAVSTSSRAVAGLEAVADIMAEGDDSSPLTDAARFGRLDEVRFLLGAGLDPSGRDRLDMAPLHYAAWFGRAEVLSLLLLSGADHSVRGLEGRTALHYAAMADHAECVSILVQHGADVLSRDDFGWTPLHSAAIGNAERATRALLAGGASTTVTTYDGETPLELAQADGLRSLLSRRI